MSRREKLFRQVLDEHRDKIYRLCAAWLYDKQYTDDLYHDVLLNIWSSLDRFKERSTLSTWVYRVTVNTVITHNRTRSREKRLFADGLPEEAATLPEHDGESHSERTEKLMACVARLKKEERLLISLVLEDLSYAEIAGILGLTVNHVGVKINRVKKKLMRIYNNG